MHLGEIGPREAARDGEHLVGRVDLRDVPHETRTAEKAEFFRALEAGRLTRAQPQKIPRKIQRQHARAVQIETGAVVIVGGASSTLESFVP